MDFHKFEIGDKVMVNVPELSVPLYDYPAIVDRIIGGGQDAPIYKLLDESGNYVGMYHPQWLTLAGGDPWTPQMRTEREVREMLGQTENLIVTDVLRWVLGELMEFPEEL